MPAENRVINYRLMTQSDIPAVVPMLRQLWPRCTKSDPDLAEMLRLAIGAPGRMLFVAEVSGRVVGFASLGLSTDLWQTAFDGVHLDELVVDAGYRGQGIGEGLLNFVMAHAKALGKRKLELTSAGHRTDAHRFYLERGFTRGETHVYTRDLV